MKNIKKSQRFKRARKKKRRIPRLPAEVRQTLRRGGPHSTPKGGRGYKRRQAKKIPLQDDEENEF